MLRYMKTMGVKSMAMKVGIEVPEQQFREMYDNEIKDPVGFQHIFLNQIPHKKQVEVLLSSQKNKVIVCGRRSGKSQMIAGELIRAAVNGIYKKQIVIAPTYKQTLIVYDKIIELMMKAGKYEYVVKEIKHPYPRIEFMGGIIDFGSADNPNSLRGEAYGRVFMDESAFIKEGAMDAIKPLTFDTGAPIWETTTPWGKGSVWERWKRGQKGDKDYGCFHYNYLDNPYLADEGKTEIEKDIEEWGKDSVYVQCEILGNFVEDRDVYFKRELIDECVNNEIPIGSLHPASRYFLGVDVAGEGEDESVFIVVEKTSKDEIRVNFIDYYNVNKPREIVGKVKILDEKYNFEKVFIDKTGMGEGPVDWLKETLSEERVDGIRFTIQSKQDLYSNLRKMMHQGLKFPNNKKLVYQLADLRYETAGSGDLKIHASEKGHDDYPDSLALACWYFAGTGIEDYEPWIF